MAYTETTRQSYGSKLSGSLKGIVFGFILLIGGTVLLWWNEGNSVKNAKAIKEAQSVSVNLESIDAINPEMNGKMVHATGVATTLDTLSDDLFGVKANAFKISRTVEYYQWVEHSESKSKEKIGGATETVTTYTYKKEWVGQPISSSSFHDPDYQQSNRVLTTIEEKDIYADNASFGAYVLPPYIISSISGSEPAAASLTPEMIKDWKTTLQDSLATVQASGNTVYFGRNSGVPNIGDVRITLTQVTAPKTISILSKVVNNTFEPFIAKNGKTISKVAMGTVSAENMYEQAHKENKLWTWVLRIVGIIIVVAGLKSIFSILSMLFAVLPFLKNLVGAATGLVCTILGLVWSLVVIAIAWIVYRPVLAISLLVVAAALIVFLVIKPGKKKTDTPVVEAK
ncbi:MAG: TMEM43 family protein [Bacteroidales bacterium]|nr:TMEM43 family protein [Bacteroidales bacterium]MDD4670469.1 TMEM43 family protein [Bacteroidales bacterium]